MNRTLAIALVALAAVALAQAQGSTMGAGSAAVGAHGEHVVDILEHEIARGRQLMDISDSGRAPAWHGRFDPSYKLSYFSPALTTNSCDPATQNCAAIPGMPNLTYPYSYIVADPNNATSTQPVMQIFYPPGAWASSQEVPSGTLIYSYPFKSNPNDVAGSISSVGATLEYQVYFPTGFDFVKGGKLPGMAGGTKNGRGCGGGADPAFCFSFRIMWRRNGQGEAYLYVPEGMQAPDFCTYYPPCSTKASPCTECNFAAGVSFGRGVFTFKTGQWNKIRMSITLNTPNVTNGLVEIKYNDQVVLSYNKINWRQRDAKIEGVEIASWYGGSDATWSPPTTTYSLIKGFKLWRADPPLAPASAARAAALATPQPQVSTVEKIISGE